MNLRVMVHSALGKVNTAIRAGGVEGYRDVLEKIEEYHFPRRFRDMVLLNNITMESTQLKDFQREANDFTTLPVPTFCYDETENKTKSLGEVLE